MRKLASIQKISEINPIYVAETGEEADSICQVKIGGWRLIAKKSEFAPGDLCVFFEVDSILPDAPGWSQFMRPRKFKVGALKMNKFFVLSGGERVPIISQGLALPLSILPPEVGNACVEGDDVTILLGVTKPDTDVITKGEIAGKFPSFIPKTDEIRLQSVLGVLDELCGLPFYITLKMDGSSITIWREEDGLHVASRNFEKEQSPDDIFWRGALNCGYGSLPARYAVQGELIGPNIQGNRLRLSQFEVVAFNVYDREEGRYLNYDEFANFCSEYGYKTVPVLVVGESFNMSFDEIETFANGVMYSDVNYAEGIVIRSQVEKYSETLAGRLSFKVINVNYLLKHGG
jgi:RNA ligase (TIGR02306 family)